MSQLRPPILINPETSSIYPHPWLCSCKHLNLLTRRTKTPHDNLFRKELLLFVNIFTLVVRWRDLNPVQIQINWI